MCPSFLKRTLVLAAIAVLTLWQLPSRNVAAQCGPNPIVCENALTGNPASEWDISGSGDATIQGFATDMSVNKGQTVRFKVSTTAPTFKVDIYRLGYYNGFGARKIDTILNVPGQNQPGCLFNSTTRLVDCGNWAQSTTWDVPSTAVSGIYLAKLTRIDSGGASHVVFVVRDDSSTSDLLFQTSDTTWQAYNQYGGYSLYAGSGGRAAKVSYNRPFATRGQGATGSGSSNFVFYSEYPTLRWLEANGYNVSYFSGIDSDRNGALIRNHKIFLSVGHDEYWSGPQRTSVEAARTAGVHLAFLSGNEAFWKTRWENSIDVSATPYRTMVCYKETHDNAKTDPQPNVWTGTWRDPRFSPPADGGRPENALTGQLPSMDRGSAAITVPSTYAALRFWRNTSVAQLTAGQTATLATDTLGYEWDEDVDNGSRPAGSMRLSATTVNAFAPQHIVDFGSTLAPGTITHNMTLYRHSSGALIFGAGTIQWVWGLDPNHDRGPDNGSSMADVRIQQATVNLLADMQVQPGYLQPGLVAATASTDTTGPSSAINSPAAGASIPAGSFVTITGTASDAGGGVLGGVEVSVDGGATWHLAAGTQNWSYSWRPGTLGSATIRSRAVDDSGNLETPLPGTTVTVTEAVCPCSFWSGSDVPWQLDTIDSNAVEVGVKFQSEINGLISGLRYYKSQANTGTHTGHLWTAGGQLLASVTFAAESATGWQQANFAVPVAISAGTTYVASYHTDSGHYSSDTYFFGRNTLYQWPLRAPTSGSVGGNGVFQYGASAFPTGTYGAANYWVDVVFDTPAGDTTPPTVTGVMPSAGATGVSTAADASATFSEAIDPATLTSSTFVLRDSGNQVIASALTYNANTHTATLDPAPTLSASSTYTATIVGGASGVKDIAGNALASDYTWSFTTSAGPGCPCTIWNASTVPGHIATDDSNSLELGVKFTSDVNGTITGVRFYKGAGNTGTHTGSLWTSGGSLLATATFTGETASGWQQVIFSSPVAVTANTTYVASYHTSTGNYAYDGAYFGSTGLDAPPLHALAAGAGGGNGVYRYGASAFPNQTWNGTNYWVDVVFNLGAPDTTPPTVTAVTPANAATNISTATSVTATFSEAINAATLTTSTFVLRNGGTTVASTVSYNSGTNVATLTPSAALAASTTYTATITGGSGGVKDVAGNALASDYSWSFTTGSGPSCPCSIWSSSTVPANIATDPNAVELGLRFRSDSAGTITGVRFYKGAANTGTHTGSLWTSTGTLLATATFTGETASGWQQVTFATPVAIAANTTYVVSYHTNAGNYAWNGAYFAGAGADSPPLHALASGVDGSNALYRYGASAFPTDSYNATNYWVDVVFVP